jgi:hypothetical protein
MANRVVIGKLATVHTVSERAFANATGYYNVTNAEAIRVGSYISIDGTNNIGGTDVYVWYKNQVGNGGTWDIVLSHNISTQYLPVNGTFYAAYNEYGLKVSEPGDNVLSPSEPLIFDSASVRSGMTYAGGSAASTTGINWSSTKGTLGYIPLCVSMDDKKGTIETYDIGDQEERYQERAGMHEVTTTNINPIKFEESVSGTSGGGAGVSRTAANFKFIVLRLPCQYGKMDDASLWS